MPKDLTLESLDKSLEQSKSRELEKVKKIEEESLKELAQSLKTSLTEELSSIKESIYEVQKFVNGKNNTLAKNAEKNTQEIMKNFTDLNEQLVKIRAKQWIIPTVMGIAIVLALALGTWGTTKYLSTQLQALQELRQTIAQTKQTQDKYVVKAWNNAVGVKNEPTTWKDSESGLWIVQYEKIK